MRYKCIYYTISCNLGCNCTLAFWFISTFGVRLFFSWYLLASILVCCSKTLLSLIHMLLLLSLGRCRGWCGSGGRSWVPQALRALPGVPECRPTLLRWLPHLQPVGCVCCPLLHTVSPNLLSENRIHLTRVSKSTKRKSIAWCLNSPSRNLNHGVWIHQAEI